MAIIRCPECGHEISDKAPFCPSCGVAIAGKVTICPSCGKVYFSEEEQCPQCHHHTERKKKASEVSYSAASKDTNQKTTGDVKNVDYQAILQNNTSESKPMSVDGAKNLEPETEERVLQSSDNDCNERGRGIVELHTPSGNRTIIIAVLVIAIAVVGTSYYFYHNAQIDSERQAYGYAMTSNDVQVLQNYLDNYENAPKEHRDSIEAHLSSIRQAAQDWTNALVSGSRNAFEQYLSLHPNSPYKSIALHKLDSIDWHIAEGQNNVEAIETYLEHHPDGEYVDDANNAIKSLNSKTIQPEEKQMVISTMKNFFNSITTRDEDLLTSTVNPLLTNFLGKPNATKADVVTFLHKIYKDDIASMSWLSLGDYAVVKNDIGNQMYDYDISFSSVQSIIDNDNTTNNTKYKIKATVNSEGKISALEMIKMVNE